MSHESQQSRHAFFSTQSSAGVFGVLKPAISGWLQFGFSGVLVSIRTMKFSRDRIKGIRSFLENSPLVSGTAQWLGIQDLSNLLRCLDILKGFLVDLREWIPRRLLIGHSSTIGTMTVALVFLAAAPKAWLVVPGELPCPVVPLQLALNSVVQHAASLWSLSETVARQSAVSN